jgi:methyl-accepting chemotaxis protein
MAKAHIEVQTQFVNLMVEYADGKFDSRMVKLPGEQQKISDAAEMVRAGLEAAAEASRQDAHVTAALVCEHP